MLLLNTRVFDNCLDSSSRLSLLDKLQEKAFTPLIRSTRLYCYKQAMFDENAAYEMERLVANWPKSANEEPYIMGDLMCLDDYILFLIFGDSEGEVTGIRAGIIYEPMTKEPLLKLDSFCHDIQKALADIKTNIHIGESIDINGLDKWRPVPSPGQASLEFLINKSDRDALSLSVRKESSTTRIRAAEILEDVRVRNDLRRVYEVYNEGSPMLMLPNETPSRPGFSVNRLENAGLVKHEVLVSCRRTGHTLFRLPSADALAVVTLSKAMCSECGTAIEDEKVEEVYAPTQLLASLLEDGSWLITRIHAMLRELGLPESEIAIAPATGDGDAYMIVNVSGESFLFVLRDGDLTPALARRAIDLRLETKSTHLVVVATGIIQHEGRVQLLNYARRRARSGQDIAVLMLEGADAARTELPHIFERVSQKAIAAQLCELDSSIGFNVSRMIITRSQLQQKAPLRLAAFSS